MLRKSIEDRQTDGHIDGQSAVETATDRVTDSRQSADVEKTRVGMQTDRQTDGQSADRLTVSGPNGDG